jgi:hypothetical protein
MTYDELKIGQVIAQRVDNRLFICIISNKDLYDENTTIYNIPTFTINDDKSIESYGKDIWYLSTKDANDSIWHLLPYFAPANQLKTEDKRKIIEVILLNRHI